MKTSGTNQSKRYSEADKKKISQFIHDYNEKHGRGGGSAAVAKFAISWTALRAWGLSGSPIPPRNGKASKITTLKQSVGLTRIKKQYEKLGALIYNLK